MKEQIILAKIKTLNEKQKKVFDILVCPIIATTDLNSIEMFHGKNRTIIISGHEVCKKDLIKNIDTDMCDLAIRFYEILYGLKEGTILKQEKEGNPIDWKYAGDTMNSFENIVKFSSERKREEWAESYHCLANFWMLPGAIGRATDSNSKNSAGRITNTIESFNKGVRDYMDRFLHEKHAKDLKDFAKGHFIEGVYVKEGRVDEFSLLKDKSGDFQSQVDGVIDKMMEKVCERAVAIVNDNAMCDKLYEYFDSLKLIE